MALNARSHLFGVIGYEFLMQLRRLSLWIAFGLLGALVIVANSANYTPQDTNLPYTRYDIVVNRADGAAVLLALGVGLLLADRLRRDRRNRVDEVLRTTPVATSTRVLGKYAGAVAATLVPVTMVYLVSVAFLVAHYQDASIIPVALSSFLTLVVPVVLFVGAFSIASTAVLWTPLYQFLFIGYIFWSFLPPGGPLPTLNGTLLSIQENYVLSGIFHFTGFRTGDAAYYPPSSVGLALASIGSLLACAAVALLAACWYETWRGNHE
jgi:ABC-2 type transport system permease protein